MKTQSTESFIRVTQQVRQGWEEQFRQMAANGDDFLLDEAIVLAVWDDGEWEWQPEDIQERGDCFGGNVCCVRS